MILARNPVHSVLFLILAFVNAAGLFLLMGAEFLGMILVVVYVGAVAVLFLFVVMMLDVDFAELKQGFVQYLPIGGADRAVRRRRTRLCRRAAGRARPTAAAAATPSGTIANTAALGRVLYTHYFYFFQAAGMILLTAMIGAIVLTLRHKVGVKRQNIADQVARNAGDGGRIAQSRLRAPAFEGSRPMAIGLTHYLTLAAILFTIGVAGIILNHKNIIIILMSVELILLAVNINLVAFSTHSGDLTGQVFALFILTVAAAEAAIGLAILVAYYRNRGSIAVEDINALKG